MASEYKLSIEPVKVTGQFIRVQGPNHTHALLTELPSPDSVLAEGRALLESTTGWKQGKTFHNVVKTFSRPKAAREPAGWYCRVSEHGSEDATFDELWEKLGVDKGNNEVL